MNIIRQGPSLRKEEEESRKVDKEKLKEECEYKCMGKNKTIFWKKKKWKRKQRKNLRGSNKKVLLQNYYPNKEEREAKEIRKKQ